jgi:MraZ protein
MWEIFPLFRGINAVNLDAKGRISIPTRYRCALEKVNNQVIVTIDTEDPCLLLYPLPEWEILEKKIENLPSFNRAARRVQRLLIGHATELELDPSGRILLPSILRDYAHIDKQVMLVGQGKKFEIWSDARWEKGRQDWISKYSDEGESVPNELLDLSI